MLSDVVTAHSLDGDGCVDKVQREFAYYPHQNMFAAECITSY